MVPPIVKEEEEKAISWLCQKLYNFFFPGIFEIFLFKI